MADTGINLNFSPEEIQPGVMVCPDGDGVARAGARMFVEWAWQAIARYSAFRVALSGGSTPQNLYRHLASETYRKQVDWAKVHLFWGDERCVPPDDPESNYGMARRELLLRVPIPGANVHRMEAERADLGRAAQEYEELLRAEVERDEHGFPRFDLIFLGLGTDGHTASLFPGARGIRTTSRWVSTPLVPKLGKRRMTLTLPVLNAARRVLFLVVGAEKAAILRTVLEENVDPPLPAQLVRPRDGQKLLLVDRAAAALLARQSGDAAQRSAPPKETREEP
jgi:6-phosphogluconolactonase